LSHKNLIQLVAWHNTPDESFVVWKWFDLGREGDLQKELYRVFQEIYSRIVKNKDFESLRKGSFRIGSTDDEVLVDRNDTYPRDDVIRFAWYEGHCLDKEKLSYFVPERVIVEGVVRVDDIKDLSKYRIQTGKGNLREFESVLQDVTGEREGRVRLGPFSLSFRWKAKKAQPGSKRMRRVE